MKTNLKYGLKSLILCFVMVCLINSCTNDGEAEIPFSETRHFQHTFSLENFNDAFIKDHLIIHWDDFNIKQDRDHHIYEFNTSLSVKNSLDNGKNTLAVTYKLLASRDRDGNPAFELIKFLSDNSGTLNTVSYFDPAAFSGTLYHYNLKGETTKIEAYKNGVSINEFTDKEKGIIDAQSKAPQVSGCEEGCYVLVITRHYSDYYLSVNGDAFTYAYSVYQGTTSEWVWVSGNGGGGHGNPDGGGYHHHFDEPHGPNIGSNNHPDEYIVEDIVEETPPSCESFNYSQVGDNNWQCAAVTGVHDLFTVFNWDCIGYDWGIFHQPLYFQLPVNSNFPLASGLTATESAVFLHDAFKAFDKWYKENACTSSHAAMEQKLLEYIKDEFEEQGGNVTLEPPMGFTGTPTSYKTSWSGYGNCN